MRFNYTLSSRLHEFWNETNSLSDRCKTKLKKFLKRFYSVSITCYYYHYCFIHLLIVLSVHANKIKCGKIRTNFYRYVSPLISQQLVKTQPIELPYLVSIAVNSLIERNFFIFLNDIAIRVYSRIAFIWTCQGTNGLYNRSSHNRSSPIIPTIHYFSFI